MKDNLYVIQTESSSRCLKANKIIIDKSSNDVKCKNSYKQRESTKTLGEYCWSLLGLDDKNKPTEIKGKTISKPTMIGGNNSIDSNLTKEVIYKHNNKPTAEDVHDGVNSKPTEIKGKTISKPTAIGGNNSIDSNLTKEVIFMSPDHKPAVVIIKDSYCLKTEALSSISIERNATNQISPATTILEDYRITDDIHNMEKHTMNYIENKDI